MNNSGSRLFPSHTMFDLNIKGLVNDSCTSVQWSHREETLSEACSQQLMNLHQLLCVEASCPLD